MATSAFRAFVRTAESAFARSVASEGIRAARGFGREPEAPGAQWVGLSRNRLRMELGGDVSTGCGPSPNVDGAIALEDGVVAEQVRQAHIGASGCRERRQAKEQNGDS